MLYWYVITTGKGLVYVVQAKTVLEARTMFSAKYLGHEVASIIQAEEALNAPSSRLPVPGM